MKKDVYYFINHNHIHAIFCTTNYINLIDPKHSKFKLADNWFTENHWPLLIEAIFNPNKMLHELIEI